MDGVGNVCFQIGDFHIEYIASAILTQIKGVLEYDNTGYVVIDTNYGEEFYDFSYTLERMGIADKFDIKNIMNSVSNWKVGTEDIKSTNIGEIRDRAKIIINNIAFGVVSKGNKNVIRAIDINNTKYVADFVFDNSIKRFMQVSSSFAEGKRKYEMLYLVERNTEELLGMYRNTRF